MGSLGLFQNSPLGVNEYNVMARIKAAHEIIVYRMTLHFKH